VKQIAVFILIILVAAQTFSKWLIVLEYKVNQDYIAKNLCKNRNKPKLHCNGKCQLAKKLAEDQKENAPDNSQGKLKFTEVIFYLDQTLQHSRLLENVTCMCRHRYQDKKYTAPSYSIFHPPLNSSLILSQA
jgi:hypothetical protein